MAGAGYNFREIRIVIEDDQTHCYVLLEALGDCPDGVQGWHHKAFPVQMSGKTVYMESVRALDWPLEAPKAWGQHR